LACRGFGVSENWMFYTLQIKEILVKVVFQETTMRRIFN